MAARRKKIPKQEVLSEVPETRGYQNWPVNFMSSLFDQRPMFNIWQADLMRVDHQVAFAHAVSNGPLMTAKVVVDSPRADVKKFAQTQWQRIWDTSATKIMRTKAYGVLAGEIMYKQTKEGVEFDYLLERHPRDTRPLVKNGRMVALRVYNCGGRLQVTNNDAKGVILKPHKAFWFTYAAEFGSRYGRPLYEKAYDPWYEKRMQGGAIPLRKLRMIKDAWIGDVFRIPMAEPLIKPDGTEFSFRDVARELQDLRMSGGGLTLPSDRDQYGNFKVDYTPPTNISGATQIMDWIHDLDWDIFDAFGTPKEVIEASESGSGYSGRQLPFEAFLAIRDEELKDAARQIKREILQKLVGFRFGYDAAQEFDLIPQSLVEAWREQQNSEGGEDSSRSGAPEPKQKIPGQPADNTQEQPGEQQQLKAQQFSAEEAVGQGALDAFEIVKAAKIAIRKRTRNRKATI